MPRPSRKNSRFSGKNRLNRVRFTCCSSTSTWAKSVFQVRSAVRFWVMPYFTSRPPSPSRELTVGVDAARLVLMPPMPYGLISRLALPLGASSPTRVPASETRKMPPGPDPAEIGSAVMYAHSFLRRTLRRSWTPQTCDGPGRYRRDLNGIPISTVQPPSKRPVRTSQMGFQSLFGLPSLVSWKSASAPRGLV